MAKFKVRNLMIDVVSAKVDRLEKLCLFPSTPGCGRFFTRDCEFLTTRVWCFKDATHCAGITRHGCAITDGGCGVNYSTCWAGSRTWIIDLERLVVNPADIRFVQEQLNEVMGNVKAGAAEVDAGPQTLEQAEALEDALKGALEEIQAVKKRLG